MYPESTPLIPLPTRLDPTKDPDPQKPRIPRYRVSEPKRQKFTNGAPQPKDFFCPDNVMDGLFSSLSKSTHLEGTLLAWLPQELFLILDSYYEYDYNDPEDSTNAAYDSKDGTLKGATFPQLISKLCSMSPYHVDIDDFLLTYRCFCSPQQFLTSILNRFESAPQRHARYIHLRIYNILGKWITNYWADFETDPTIQGTLQEFLANVQKRHDSEWGYLQPAYGILEKIRRQTAPGFKLKIPETYPDPIIGKNPMQPLLDDSPLEIARQMTLMTWQIWRAIKPWECLGLAWTKPELKSPHVQEMIKNFNYIRAWVATSIVITPTLKKRFKLLKKFLNIALHLR